MNKNLKEELKTAFNPPTPTEKRAFLNNLSYPRTSNLDFFFSQIGYIRKRFWCLSTVITVAIILLIHMFDSMYKTIGIVSAFFPFLVVLSATEISRSSSFYMAEMEMSCRYNLGKITLVRLTLIGSFHFILLLCMVLIFVDHSEYSFLQYSLYSITPCLLCAYLALFIMNHFPTKEIAYICGGVAGVVSLSVLLLAKNFEMIYLQKCEFAWAIAFISIVILFIKEVKNLLKRTEELQWNSLSIV
jgi:hypothetical protein